MSKLPRLSGKDIIKVLTNRFGFEIENWKGSHCTLVNHKVRPPTRLIVPGAHGEVMRGTLTSIIHNSGISREEFLKATNS